MTTLHDLDHSCWKCHKPVPGDPVEAVALSGWYAAQGGWARVVVNLANPAFPCVAEVACLHCGIPSAEEEEARLQASEDAYQKWLATRPGM